MRRETLWAPIPAEVNVITGGGSALIYVATAAEDALRPYTIVRTHLYLGIQTDQLAMTEDQAMAIGFAVVADQASAIGVTAVPTPITDLDSDAWYLHQFLTSAYFQLSAVGQLADAVSRVNVDSRAMRKVEDGFDNITTVEAVTAFAGVNIFTGGRQLLKLH